MRVVHVESGRYLYGGARQVAYLIAGLDRRGVENVLVCPPDHALAEDRARVERREVPMYGDFDLGMVRRLRRAFAELEPDVVHVHSRRGADLFGGLACRGEGHAALLTRRVDNPEPRAFARFKYRPYRFVVAISRAVRDELCGPGGIDPGRVPTVASAVDTEAFRPDSSARERVLRAFELEDDAFIVGVCAQLIARKGHEFFLRCLPNIVRSRRNVRVLCFGRGPLSARLQRLAAELGLSGHVQFPGFRDDLAQLLPGFDLLVHPAEREGLGVAVLEAMAAEVAVVATAVGGIVDAVSDGHEGLLVPWGDAARLAGAVERMVDDAAARTHMGAAGRIRAERDFSIARMTERYLQLYRDVC
jgi:glycosyltransferase involved in cell wall biosynthesis